MTGEQPGDKKQPPGNEDESASDAKFIGWQKTSKGELFALYNVTAATHPLFRSTVTEKTLVHNNLQIPQIPGSKNQFREPEEE